MSYFQEFRSNWRYIGSATLGMAFGYNLTPYTMNIFAPHLLKAFGWSKAELALVGTTSFISILVLPLVGRIIDRLGARLVITAGVAIFPLVLLAFGVMQGSFWTFLLISLVQGVVVGTTTTSLPYMRLIGERFDRAKGLALATAACAPAAVGALCVPLLSVLVDTHGWRLGYVAFAACAAVAGTVALLVMPSKVGADLRRTVSARAGGKSDYQAIFADRAFQLIFLGMLFCNLSFVVQTSQLKILLLDRGMASNAATALISAYALGVVGGRIGCGAALDRFPAHIVAAVSMGLPSIGLLTLASGIEVPALLLLSVLFLGLSTGSESDLAVYLVLRHFRLELYGTVLGLVSVALALSAALGAALLSLCLKLSGAFSGFLYLTTCATLLGAALLYSLGHLSRRVHSAALHAEVGAEKMQRPSG